MATVQQPRVINDVPPAHEIDAERAVLGAVLIEGAAALRRLSLRPEDFYVENNRDLFRAMQAVDARGEGIDAVTVAAELRRTGDLDRIGGPAALALLLDHASILVHLASYERLIREAADKREFHALSEQLRAGAMNGATVENLSAWACEVLTRQRERAARQRPDEAPSELTALLAHRFPPRADLIARGVLPRGGLLLIGGAPKLGKSLLLDNLCAQRARGRSWLGFATDPGVSLVVQSEMRARAVAERFRTMLRDDPEPIAPGRLHIKARRGVMLDDPAGLAQIEGWIEETGADLLRIDPLARHMTGDENSNRDMGAVVRAVDRLIERYGVGVVIAHHPSKPKEGEPRQGGMRLRGASALFGAADTVVSGPDWH